MTRIFLNRNVRVNSLISLDEKREGERERGREGERERKRGRERRKNSNQRN